MRSDPPPLGSPAAPRRRWVWRLAGGGVGVVVLVVGGPFVYIHFIEGTPPAPLSLNSSTSSTTAVVPGASVTTQGTTSTVDGTYSVGPGSQAGYRVGEVLFGQTATAVGRTSSITGTVTITGTTVSAAAFSVDMTSVKSDRTQRDGQFQGRIMNTSTYPTATFVLTKPIDIGSLPAEGATITESATGNLMLHGVTKPVTFTVTAKRTATAVAISGSIPVVFADYAVNNPSGGPATTQDHGIVEFVLNLAHA